VEWSFLEKMMITMGFNAQWVDLLSPYVFIFCAEGLSGMLSHAKNTEELKGVQVCRDDPMITHLLFVDDSLTLMEASEENAEKLKHILDLYCDSQCNW
jgi:hypothetical protein